MRDDAILGIVRANNLSLEDRDTILDITTSSFPGSRLERDIISSYHFNSPLSYVVLSRISGTIRSFIFLARTSLAFNHSNETTISIGPIATHPQYRRRGLLRLGLDHVETSLGCTAKLMYLQGAAGIYSSLGFKPFAKKSKVLIRYISPTIPHSHFSLTPSQFSPLEAFEILQAARKHDKSIISNRSISTYQELINHGSGCVLFHQPQGLRIGTMLVAYFTSDPGDRSTIRELVISSPKYTTSVLMHIAQHMPSSFEIYTSLQGPLSKACRRYTNCIISEASFIDGGNMYKLLGPSTLDPLILKEDSFMLQGDNL